MEGLWLANDDIPINILSRLPAKVLHYVKYVSKEWFNHITKRSFIFSIMRRTEPVAGYFLQRVPERPVLDDTEGISYVSVSTENVKTWSTVLNFLPEKVVILSSVNGLLCCRSCLPTFEPMIYICNPLNKQWTSLQWHNLPIGDSSSTTFSNTVLAFDPLRNRNDASMNFKLVSISYTYTKSSFFFDIYSSKTGSWRRSRESCLCSQPIHEKKGVFVEGKLYWLTRDADMILMFDPENEVAWLFTTPPSGGFLETCIGVSEGKLNCTVILADRLQLWVLDDLFSSEWSLKYSKSLEEIEIENPDIHQDKWNCLNGYEYGWVDPLAFQDGLLLLRVSKTLYLYNFDSNGMKELYDVERRMPSPIVVPYTMSLFAIDTA